MDNEQLKNVNEDGLTEYTAETQSAIEDESLVATTDGKDRAQLLEDGEQVQDVEKPVSPVRIFFSIFTTIVLIVATIVMAITVVLNTFVFFKVRVSGPSMQPTLYTGNLLIANRYGVVSRGAIIIIKGEKPDSDDWLIKRVIGVGGDTVEFVGGFVKVNGEFIDEPYLKEQGVTTNKEQTKFVIPEGEIFYLGDNRIESADSRTFGTCTTEQVVGVVENWSMLFKNWFNK